MVVLPFPKIFSVPSRPNYRSDRKKLGDVKMVRISSNFARRWAREVRCFCLFDRHAFERANAMSTLNRWNLSRGSTLK